MQLSPLLYHTRPEVRAQWIYNSDLPLAIIPSLPFRRLMEDPCFLQQVPVEDTLWQGTWEMQRGGGGHYQTCMWGHVDHVRPNARLQLQGNPSSRSSWTQLSRAHSRPLTHILQFLVQGQLQTKLLYQEGTQKGEGINSFPLFSTCKAAWSTASSLGLSHMHVWKTLTNWSESTMASKMVQGWSMQMKRGC